MVAIKDVLASNANIKGTFPNPVAIFVGGTSGIGLSTMEQLAQQTVKPTIYLVGRSQKAGAEILENLKKLNPAGIYNFIATDAALIANVDKVCSEIKLKERKIDLIVLSCGYLGFSYDPTTEGLDKLLSLRYYARLRFVQQLLSLHPTRVVSVLAATTENAVNEADLAIKDPKNYGVMQCAAHSSSMTSLSFEHLAETYPTTSFVHCFPGFVKTPVLTRFPSPIVNWLMAWIVLPLFTPFATPLDQAGARTLFYLTSARYPPREGPAGVPRTEGVPVAKGNGAYLMSATSESGEGKVMAGYREKGLGATIWEHTEALFKEVEAKSK